MSEKSVAAVGSEQTPLGEAVLRYQTTGQGLEAIMAGLAWEFYLYFYPRLRRLLLRYRDRGVPFEHYFHSVLYWNWKSYRRCARRRDSRRRADRELCRLAEAQPENGIVDPAPEPPAEPAAGCPEAFQVDEKGVIKGAASRRRFLFLALRHVRLLTPEAMDRLARLTGCNGRWIQATAAALRDELQPKERRMRLFQQRRNEALFRCYLLERELEGETDAQRREALKAQIARLSHRMCAAAHTMARISLCPTHEAIAAALSVPKGTVDTGLRWCRITGHALYGEGRVRYA